MLRVLLAKDLRRAWRNPIPWVINLVVPLAITALIGLAFGGKSDRGALGRIRFAVVDEDDSVVTRFLRGAAGQDEAGKYLDPVFLDRTAALKEINENRLAAVLIIPEHFTRDYLGGGDPVRLELIKNPAQSIHPAVLEEMVGAVVTALNALARNFRSEFPEWRALIEGRRDYQQAAALVERAGAKFEAAREYLAPPLISYEKEKGVGKAPAGPEFNLFGYLLVGMVAMFLLFLASNAMTDLHRELRNRTFERYQTLHQRLSPFITSKVVFAVVLLLVSSAVMLGGGGLIFQIHWPRPVPLSLLVLGYAGFAAGLMATLVALVPDERRAGVLNNIAGMVLGLAGGCAFPPQQLPGFLREHVTPHLPTYWFVDALRRLNTDEPGVGWTIVLVKLTVLAVLLVGLAALLFRRRFRRGVRA